MKILSCWKNPQIPGYTFWTDSRNRDYLFKSSNGDVGLKIFICALLDQIVVDLSGAEDEFLDVRCVVSRWTRVWDEALEVRVLRHLVNT